MHEHPDAPTPVQRAAHPAPQIRMDLAARAMQGALAATAGLDAFPDAEVIAEYAVSCADALLAELAKPVGEASDA